MPRKLRLEFSGACYHVINRGNYRRDLFTLKGAAAGFERCLFEACRKFHWLLHAFVVMSNHYHLAITTPEPNLSLGMKWLQGTWAMRFNRFRGESGRPFQGRYKGIHLEPGHALAQVCHYIHLNPVRAGLVVPDRIREHRYSSLHWLARRDRPDFIATANLRAASGGFPDTIAGWKNYRAYLALIAEEDPQKREERFSGLNKGWIVGSEDFKRTLRNDLATQGGDREQAYLLGHGSIPEVREQHWGQQLMKAACALQLDHARLPAKASTPEKVRLAAILKATTSASNAWIAERLSLGQPTSVSQLVRRFHLAGGDREASYAAALSHVMT